VNYPSTPLRVDQWVFSERFDKKLQNITGRNRFQRQVEHFNETVAYELTRGDLVDWSNILEIRMSLFVHDKYHFPVKLKKPLKKEFPKLTNRDKSFSFSCDEASVNFDEGSLSMTWNVEGNHSAEQAHESYMFIALCRVFNNYKWKRKEGGVFHHIDEYDRDQAIDSGGATQSTMSYSFGPLGKEMKDDAWKATMQQFRR
jgi:hypothetical protein